MMEYGRHGGDQDASKDIASKGNGAGYQSKAENERHSGQDEMIQETSEAGTAEKKTSQETSKSTKEKSAYIPESGERHRAQVNPDDTPQIRGSRSSMLMSISSVLLVCGSPSNISSSSKLSTGYWKAGEGEREGEGAGEGDGEASGETEIAY